MESYIKLILACIWLIAAVLMTVRVCISFNGWALTAAILDYIAFALHLANFIFDVKEK